MPHVSLRHLALSLLGLSALAGTAIAQEFVTDGAKGQADNPAKPGPEPLSTTFGVSLIAIPAQTLPNIDNNALWQQDQTIEANGGGNGVMRLSIEVPIEFDWTSGLWYDVPQEQGGGKLWVLDIVSPTAWGVRPHFADFNLPPGAQMTVYAPTDLAGAPWPYEGKGRKNTGEFWARTAFGNTARVEVYVPADAQIDEATPLFKIDKIHHWFINMRTGTPSGFSANELGCHQDVNCHPWANEASAVCLIFFNGGGCSASILNTAASDWTPYMYTAAHCFSTQPAADSLETYWFYQSSACNAGAPGSLPSGINRADDATLLSTGGVADHTLVMIEGSIRRDLYWLGWDTGLPGNGTAVNAIHHPRSTYKRFSSSTVTSPNLNCTIPGIGAGIRGSFTLGLTEPGSSGSPMLDGNRRVRGALSCATSTCSGTNFFYYGPLNVAYPNFSSLLNGGSDDNWDIAGFGDTCAVAPAITSGAGSGTLSGLILKSVDEDWYSFVVPAFGSLNATLNFVHAWGDIDAQLTDGCGGAILTSSGGTSNTETITWANASGVARTVKLRAYLYNDTRANYSISYNVQGPPAPTNDTCFSANPLTNGVATAGSNIGATSDSNASCAGSNSDIWYTFFVPCDNAVTITTAGSNFDTVVSVHTACPIGGGAEVACNDDFGGTLQSQVNFQGVANTLYYVRVASFGGRAQGNLAITATLDRFWQNDVCEFSFGPLGPGNWTYDSCASTFDGPRELLCGSFAGTVFFADFWNDLVAPSNGTFTVNTFGTGFDTMLAAYVECPTGPDQAVACNDDFGSLQSQIDFAATAGATYKLRTGGYNGQRGPGLLNIFFTPDAPSCDSIDFNNDGLFPDDADLVDFLNVLAGGSCSNDPLCNDIDFNNDGLFPDDTDLVTYLTVLAGGDC